MSTLVKDSNGEWKQAAGNYSVWQGTRAELEAALAGGTIPNGTVALVTDDYAMQGVSCVPDWDHAVSVTQAQLYAGYTCPDNGFIVAGSSAGYISYFFINGIQMPVPTYNSYGNGFGAPVKKDDVLTSSRSDMWFAKFIPWKK